MPKLLRRWQPMRMGRPLPAFVWIFSKNESILKELIALRCKFTDICSLNQTG